MNEIEFRVLGPLEVSMTGQRVTLGGRKPRMLLATLLLEPNTMVGVDTLVDVLWPDSPPRSAVANVRTYAHALRNEIGARVCTRPGGYLVNVDPDELDMTAFEAKAELGQLDEATALWRGRMLADLPRSPVWEPTLARLEELRLSVIERSLTVREDTIPELRGLLAEHPLREELWRHLVLALHQSGRTAEALHAYHEAERILAEELGTRPGPELRRAGDEIRTSAFPVCQLPIDIPDFTGRIAVVREIEDLLHGPKPVVAVLTGAAGSGKSTVAVHIGHRMAPSFPDGQLYVELRGDRDPFDVLAYLLDALGIQDIPGTLEARAARYRSVLARRKMLVILDDATSSTQVTPLLPGSGGSAVMVTSRTRIPDLHGAVPISVKPMNDNEARDLLARITGRNRVADEPDHATGILRACGNLPLAVRVAGAKLAARPAIPLRVIAERLRDERGRIDELTAGNLTVRTSVTDSYIRLTPMAARAFRFASMLGPVSFPGWAVAALLDRPRADDTLDSLVDANLLHVTVDVTGSPRYRIPTLFRCYAGERLAAEPRQELQAATRRVLSGYLALATHAAARMPVPFFGVLPHNTVTGNGPGDPAGWFDAERTAMAALLELAARLGVQQDAWQIPASYATYFDLRGHHADWLRTHEIALDGARQAGDPHGEAIVQRNLGQVHLYQDRYVQAESAMRESLRLFTEAGDDNGAGIALAGIGTTHRIHGRLRDALAHQRKALGIFIRTEQPHLEAAARVAAGTVLLAQKEFSAAESWLTGARKLSAAIGDRHREAHALQRLAKLREPAQALDHLAEVADVFQQLGDDHCLAYARHATGELHLRAGDRDRAQALLTKSLDAHLRTGDRRSAAEVSQLLDEIG
ncbi:DNA-binding SARP family transcriptional activator/tetratricopeptide (TPR) repeat protein [Kibdelosporangium banguiense]|uniref:DNA-binding SARP family transcriptional activator/tetratricopeptide (TPR) repeat protein n=1 Tax=Kibdelosporangium banguiense TaxID=1365924 RepID=A0ABS4TM09_9PSEU|nr:BTAD domain-containing putative transcriptional regulator [Kibdelosporangium banguiense]MBP2325431.1 DNA-binding SARP family transcriptional activator/tetratricopeptide (TPR) repeat protein [Kibdelosporangium banguiense]